MSTHLISIGLLAGLLVLAGAAIYAVLRAAVWLLIDVMGPE